MEKYDISLINKNDTNIIEYIANNLETIFTVTWNKDQFLNQIYLDNTNIYILKNENNIVGFICLKLCLDEAEILNISVNKEFRNSGLGDYLLKNIINILKEKNFSKIFLEVNVNNIFAINLYKKNNFEIISTRKNYYTNKNNNTKEDAYIMTKKI